MSPRAKKLLELFTTHANWKETGLSADTERFHDFIISAYKNNDHGISQDEFLEVVKSQTKNDPE